MNKVEYKKLKITGNALVKRGAVGVKAIFKSAEQKVVKSDDSKQEMFSIMYMVNQFDSHGATIRNGSIIDEACLDFMLNGEKRVKLTHTGEFVDAYVKELYVVPAGHPIWSDEKYIGALAVVTKFHDTELYNQCKEEGWETSLEGEVIEEPIDEESIVAKVYNKIKNLLKSGEPTMTNKAEGDVLILNQSLIDISKSEKSFEDKLNDLKLLLAKYEMPAEAPETVEDSTQKVDEVVSPLMMEAIKTAVNEAITPISSKYDELKTIVDSKYDELKSMIETSSGTIANISETAKSYDEKIREIRKDFLLEKENQETPVVKSTYKSPLS